MAADHFAEVAVIGTGMMGPGMALAFAQGGCRVALVGRSAAGVERGRARFASAVAFLV